MGRQFFSGRINHLKSERSRIKNLHLRFGHASKAKQEAFIDISLVIENLTGSGEQTDGKTDYIIKTSKPCAAHNKFKKKSIKLADKEALIVTRVIL